MGIPNEQRQQIIRLLEEPERILNRIILIKGRQRTKRELLALNGISYDKDRVQKAKGDKMGDVFAEVDGMEREAEMLSRQYLEAQKIVEAILEEIREGHEEAYTVLYNKYINHVSVEETADQIHIARATGYRRKEEGLQLLGEKERERSVNKK